MLGRYIVSQIYLIGHCSKNTSRPLAGQQESANVWIAKCVVTMSRNGGSSWELGGGPPSWDRSASPQGHLGASGPSAIPWEVPIKLGFSPPVLGNLVG